MAVGQGFSNGPNSRPLNDTVAETGPGIADDAVLPGELAPGELEKGSDEALAALEGAGWAKPSTEEAEAETQAHPS